MPAAEVVKTPAERVRFILGQNDDDDQPHHVSLDDHKLFIQMDVLVHFEDEKMGWKEQARWLKYEETVETGDRWSKPHVPTPTMHGLLELRKAFLSTYKQDIQTDIRCAIGFGLSPRVGHQQLADALMETIKTHLGLDDVVCAKIQHTVLEPHKHLHRHAHKKHHHHHQDQNTNGGHRSDPHMTTSNTQTTLSLSSNADDDYTVEMTQTNPKGDKKKNKIFRRRDGSGKDLASAYYSYPEGCSPDNLEPYKPNKKLTKKLPIGCESANILIGQVDFLQDTVMALCRLDFLSTMADMTEVAVPTRFIFIMLGPTSTTNIWELCEVGRAMAVLLNDKIFCEVAYKAKTSQDLVDGTEEFIDDLLVLPPSLWDPATRLEPPKDVISMDKIRNRLEDSTRHPTGADDSGCQDHDAEQPIVRTGKMFGGMIGDIKRRYPLYLSDIKDALSVQCLASTIFLFFACITPIVTFGGLMSQKTDGYIGTMETLLSGFVCGVTYAIFSGQPLTIIGSTGPLLVFESILYHMCKENGMDFMSFRLWIGVWIMTALIVIVALDLSALVCYITRFTEECFSILISAIFIFEAFSKIADVWSHSILHVGVRTPDCYCLPVNSPLNHTYDENVTGSYMPSQLMSNWSDYFRDDCVTRHNSLIVTQGCITKDECLKRHWDISGITCGLTSPDIFFLSVILFLGTFSVAYFFRSIRTSRFFPSIVRRMLADFAVPLSIIIWTLIDIAIGIGTKKLDVPAEFKTTRSDRGWIINPGALTHWWLAIVAIVPALLATILIFLDQQITAVIVNRKEHKLKKGHGYHLDLFVVALLVGICSLLGLPWFVAATVRSIAHVKSLVVTSETSMPGERPQMLGCREQRVTGVFIHIFIGLATLLTSVLCLIPMPVLYGVFLYMGVTSLGGVQFFERILIIFMPPKYQPDYIYLRHVRTKRVHIFTGIQFSCMVVMWVIKSVKTTSIAFPLLLVALIGVRKMLDYIFTQSDLYWLDHLLPEAHRRAKEDNQQVTNTLQLSLSPVRNIEPRRKSLTLAPEPVELSEKALEAEGRQTNV